MLGSVSARSCAPRSARSSSRRVPPSPATPPRPRTPDRHGPSVPTCPAPARRHARLIAARPAGPTSSRPSTGRSTTKRSWWIAPALRRVRRGARGGGRPRTPPIASTARSTARCDDDRHDARRLDRERMTAEVEAFATAPPARPPRRGGLRCPSLTSRSRRCSRSGSPRSWPATGSPASSRRSPRRMRCSARAPSGTSTRPRSAAASPRCCAR